MYPFACFPLFAKHVQVCHHSAHALLATSSKDDERLIRYLYVVAAHELELVPHKNGLFVDVYSKTTVLSIEMS